MKPFNFPEMMGKLGNWPGVISTNAAQALLGELRLLPSGSIVGELGFNGGRTTIIASWAAASNGLKIGVMGQIPTEAAHWLKRAIALFQLDKYMISGLGENQLLDALIVNAQIRFDPSYIDIVRPDGGTVLILHQPPIEIDGARKVFDVPGEIAIFRRDSGENIPRVREGRLDRSERFKIIKGGHAVVAEEDRRREEKPSEETEMEARNVDQDVDRETVGNGSPGMVLEDSGVDPQALAPDQGPASRDNLNGSGDSGSSEGDSKTLPEG